MYSISIIIDLIINKKIANVVIAIVGTNIILKIIKQNINAGTRRILNCYEWSRTIGKQTVKIANLRIKEIIRQIKQR